MSRSAPARSSIIPMSVALAAITVTPVTRGTPIVSAAAVRAVREGLRMASS
jgi:hypothetical protein